MNPPPMRVLEGSERALHATQHLERKHFEEAWRNRTNLPFEGISIPFLSREDLLRSKRATGRAQDLADLEALGEKPEKGK